MAAIRADFDSDARGGPTPWCNCICSEWRDLLRLLSQSIFSMHWGRWSDMKMQICVNMKEVVLSALYAKIHFEKFPIHFLLPLPLHSGVAGALSNWVKAGWRPGQATSSQQGYTKRRTFTLTYGQFGFWLGLMSAFGLWEEVQVHSLKPTGLSFSSFWSFLFNVHFWKKN